MQADTQQAAQAPMPDAFMRRALRLAALGRHASPNPMVGCVLVSGGEIVGEGWHREPGTPHAEVHALRAAGERAGEATAYVTLEPCAHWGRTPPCADALLAANVARVVVAMTDPDPRVSGQGLDRLRANGMAVSVGVLEAEARALNAAYVKHRTTGLPWVVLKTATTLDGKIATETGDSRWITSPPARRAVHRQLRDRCDGILTGVGTVLSDDPALTTRLTHRPGRDPWRIVVDSRLQTPLEAQVVRLASEDGRTILATVATADAARRDALTDHGCQILVCEADGEGRVSLPDLLRRLGTRGDMAGVLVEGGGTLAGSLLGANLIDRWLAFLAPKVVGGRAAPGPFGDLGVRRMADARAASFRKVRRCGPDLVIDARFGPDFG